MSQATARHILVDTEEKCQDLMNRIQNGEDFAALAAEHSSCPSGKSGGALGTFGPGQMVPEFDKVVFSADIGTVQGPVKTQFGYHLLEVTDRQESSSAQAAARHILVDTEEKCQDLMNQIESGEDFAALAAEHSSCPSGRAGGALGTFGPGQMVPEFDKVVFSAEIGKVQGPVKTQFGYHLLEVTSRNG